MSQSITSKSRKATKAHFTLTYYNVLFNLKTKNVTFHTQWMLFMQRYKHCHTENSLHKAVAVM